MSNANPHPTPRPETALADTMPPTPKDGFDRPTPPEPARAFDRIPRNFGRYRIGECLGKGGMGAVFKAHDTQLDRQVALKVPFLGDDGAETRERFYREARAAATLHHANICPVFDVGEHAGMPYLTMAFIEGRSLAEARTAGQSFSWVQIAVLMRKLALAMQEAHKEGIVHRDLKPANVLLRANNEPTIMDFGLASRRADKPSQGLTQKGDILGTVDYMSPEQVEGKNDEVDARADIYALGVMMYELLTGRLPFQGTTTAILAYIIVQTPPRPRDLRPDVPPQLEEICLKAMAKQAKDRYATMGQFGAALGEYLRSYAQGATANAGRPSDPPAVAPPPPPREPIVEQPPVERKSATKSANRRSRSSRRRKVRPPKKSNTPLILGGLAAGVAVVGILGALIAFWPGGEKKTAQATAPAAPVVPTRIQGPPVAQLPMRPTGAAGGAPTNTSPAPKTRGFDLRVQPESVTLAVGIPVQITLKVDRKGYQGPINLSWTGVKDARVTPPGPVTLQPGQPDPVITVLALAQPANPTWKLDVTATPTQDASRGTATCSLAVEVPAGPCVRVVEIGDKPAGSIECMAITADATLALIGGGAGKMDGPNAGQAEEKNAIQVWNLATGQPLSALAGHTNKVIGLSVSADGKTGLSVSDDQTVATWDLALGKRKHFLPKQGLRVLSAAMSADGRRGLIVYPGSGTTPGLVVKVNLDRFQLYHTPINTAILLGSKVEDAVRATSISPDHKLGLIGGVNGKLFLIDMNKPEVKPKALVGHSEAVLCAAFSPSAGSAATAGGGVLQVGTLQPGKDNAVRMWNTATATLEWSADGHNKSVVCLAFSADGTYLASGSADGEIRVWNAADGKPVATFTGHSKPVLALAFTADQKHLWSGAGDRTLRYWRLSESK
jgi:serine/threonine protein kinase